MDDTKQSAAEEAQAAREEGAEAQYDLQDEQALEQQSPSSGSVAKHNTLDKETQE